jgi:hypothetical protein
MAAPFGHSKGNQASSINFSSFQNTFAGAAGQK